MTEGDSGSEGQRGTARWRFDEWMAHALHDPQRGYYASQVRTVGRRGDFSTSASVSATLGQAIAHWLREELKAGSRGVSTVIEVGGGSGALSQAVRESLGWWTRRRLQWRMVETSAPLRAQQEAVLGGKGAAWHAMLREALDACEGRAIIFHNELLDAFPVRVMQWNVVATKWCEVWVVRDEERGTWREEVEGMEREEDEQEKELELGRMFGAMGREGWKGVELRDGQRVEVAAACRDWMGEWASHWKQGAMLTIDYGDTFPQLYHRQPGGTVRAYFMQQRLTGAQVYENIGKQDVTADVNFSDVMAWGAALRWKAEPLMTQRAFLLRHGSAVEARAQQDPAVRFLIDEWGAGSAFKVLVQRRA